MPRIVLHVKALKWGNSYGLRVAKADFERAGLHVGQEVEVDILGKPGKIDVSKFPSLDLGSLTRADRDAGLEARRAEKESRGQKGHR